MSAIGIKIKSDNLSARDARTKMDTEYARSIGYAGEKDVVVADGRVVSHRNITWFDFCNKARKTKK